MGLGSSGRRRCGTLSVSRTMAAMVWCPSGEKCRRSGSHIRGSLSCRSAHKSAMTTSCRAAMTRIFSLNTATFPRMCPNTAVSPQSGPVNRTTVAPVAESAATASSRAAAIRSGSPRWNTRSFPPAERVTRSGFRFRAGPSCWSRISRRTRPLMARFAYPNSPRPSPSSSAMRSAHPRMPPGLSGSGSPTPAVNESPKATYRLQGRERQAPECRVRSSDPLDATAPRRGC